MTFPEDTSYVQFIISGNPENMRFEVIFYSENKLPIITAPLLDHDGIERREILKAFYESLLAQGWVKTKRPTIVHALPDWAASSIWLENPA